MTVCKITCPYCSTDHEVDFSALNKASILECNICSNEFSLNNPAEESRSPAPKTKRPKKNFRKTGSPALSGRHSPAVSGRHRRAVPSRQSSSSDHTKMIINLCVFGLGLIIVSVLAFKLFGSKQNNGHPVAKQNEQNTYDKSLKTEIAELKKQLSQKQSTASAQTSEASKSGLVSHKNLSSVTKENTGLTEDVSVSGADAPAFAKAEETLVEDKKRDEVLVVNVALDDTQQDAPEEVTVSQTDTNKNMILIESEQAELDELSKLQQFELKDDEVKRLNELKNKYLWYKANRYKMSREDMDYAWDRRWTEILASNSMVRSRSDALLPRPLQILLEEAKTAKERAYLMRIYQKPVSFEEKELVRKARNQAIWEKRKEDGPQVFADDAKKKRNEKYIDEYGYEYYLNDKGQRIYL